MKTPFTAANAAPALTRAQIDAIVSAGALTSEIIHTREGAGRGALASSVRNAAVSAAAYGCVDWYLYPDSHGESEAA